MQGNLHQFVPRMRGEARPRRQIARTAAPATEGGRTALMLPVGRGQHTTIPAWMKEGNEEPARVPGGLQQQRLFGTHMPRDHSPDKAVVGQVGVTSPIGRGRQTTVLSCVRAKAGWLTLATGGLQRHKPRGAQQGEVRVVTAVTHPAPRGAQQENGAVPATVATHPAAVPPSEECE